MIARKPDNEGGFTLLEVLVTLSILAVGAALTLSLISGALANIRKVQLRTRTIQHAETVMELSLLDEAIKQPTSLRGDFEDGTRWALFVNEMEMPQPVSPTQQRPTMPVKVFSYSVEVFAPGSATPDLRLHTLKLISVYESQSRPGLPPGLP